MTDLEDYVGVWKITMWTPKSSDKDTDDRDMDDGDELTFTSGDGGTLNSAVNSRNPRAPLFAIDGWLSHDKNGSFVAQKNQHDITVRYLGLAKQKDVDERKASRVNNRILAVDVDDSGSGARMHKGTYHAEG